MNVGNLSSSATASLLGLRTKQIANKGLIIPAANAPVTPQPAVPAPGDGTTTATNPLSLDGFQKTWGTNDPTYDLNADGNVDINDISQWISDLMHEMSGPGNDAAIQPGASDSAASDHAAQADPTPAQLNRAGFDRAWGSDNSNYDLNGDGTVNIDDLTQWVLNINSNPQPQQPADSNLQTASLDQPAGSVGPLDAPSTPTDIGEVADIDDDALTTQAPLSEDAQAWQDQWGHSGSLDLNNDGTVNIDDLTQWVLGQSGANNQYKPLENTAQPKPAVPGASAQPVDSRANSGNSSAPVVVAEPNTPAGVGNGLIGRTKKPSINKPLTSAFASLSGKTRSQSAQASASTTNVSRLAAQVISKLQAQGFRNVPPQNINQLIDGLKLNGSDRQSMARQIVQAYPNGLGINEVG